MKRIVLLTALLASSALAAPNAPAGSPRVQGTPDGFGDPVQVTIVAADGDTPAATVLGSVAIDQTTPGTTNGVAVTSALPTGTNAIGTVTVAGTSGGAVVSAGTGGDGAGTSNIVLYTAANDYVFNGTSWDRQRQVINATNSTGTGIAAAGQLGQRDDTSPQACTENQFCNVRITAGGMQLNSPASVVPYSAILGTPAVQLANSSGNVASNPTVATLTGTATTTVYISGFNCAAGGSTGAALFTVAVTGTLGGTLSYTVGTPAGATTMGPGSIVDITFNPPHPASAVNTPIVVTMPDLGAGNTHSSCTATGFYM